MDPLPGSQSQPEPEARPEPGPSQSLVAGATEGVKLERRIGLANGISIIMGVIIGSGIFVSPKGVLQQSGSSGAALAIWCLCGLKATLGALCFAELGTSVAQSGGDYIYIRLAYGPLPAFLYLWVLVLVIMPCSNAVSALTFAYYVLQPFYGTALTHADCSATSTPASFVEPPAQAIRLLALAILLLLVYVNCASVRSTIRVQNAFTLAKVLALAMIIAYGFYYLLAGAPGAALIGPQSTGSIWAGTQTSVPLLAQAFYAGVYTYAGWNTLNCVTEELKSPAKNLPRAIVVSMASITLIYILANAAYFAVLSKAEILSSEAVAVVFGERTLPRAIQWLMPLSVAMSTVGGLNGGVFSASRVLLSGAREGQLFSALDTIHLRYLTPVTSLLFLGLISSLYLVTTDILALIDYIIFVEASFASLAVSTTLALRYKYPDLPRPIRVPTLVPVLFLLFSFLIIVLPVWTSPVEAAIGLAIMLAGVPVYYLTVHWKRKPPAYQAKVDTFNEVLQKLTVSVKPAKALL